jgi:hypothetical protein
MSAPDAATARARAAPFHEGELEIQRRLGELDLASHNGRAISGRIVTGAFGFVAAQPFAVAGTCDRAGAPWASVLYGAPGFARVADERHLVVELGLVASDPLAPWLAQVEHDPRLALLFLAPATRRRLRVNGRVTRAGSKLRLEVVESYPNCPKYIRRRRLVELASTATAGSEPLLRGGVELARPEQELVTRADTFFVASANPGGELDVSHRGGIPGFVRLHDARTLSVPDYPGNHLYNTLGNLALDPRAGLAFVDFETGRHASIGVRAEILHDVEDVRGATGGTRRCLRLSIEEWRSWSHPARPRWEPADSWPANPPVAEE